MGEAKPLNQMAGTIEQAIHDLLWLGQRGAWRGASAVLAERRRQIEQGYGPSHDREHDPGWLGRRAAVQAAVGSYMAENDPDPDAAQSLCAEAGALAMAEIDRTYPGLAAAAEPPPESGWGHGS